MKTRIISGAIIIAYAVFAIICGGLVAFLSCLAISLVSAGELYRAVKVRPKDKYFGLMDTAAYIMIAVYYVCILAFDSRFRLMSILAAFIVIMAVYVFTFPKYKSRHAFAAFTGVIYTGVMFSCVYLTRMLPAGIYHVWLIIIASAGCDTAAYFTGVFLGRHKMAPVLSPKKTWEGAAGGIIGAAVLGVLFALIFKQNIPMYLLISLIGSVVSMIGDLTASAIKRNMDIKDYGRLIPGHGGMLDRVDSIIFTAPVVYYLSLFLL